MENRAIKQGVREIWIVQFRVCDIVFWSNISILPRQSPLTLIHQDNSDTMITTNQNNERRGQLIHQEALTNRKTWPIRALAKQVDHILINDGINNNIIAIVYANFLKAGIQPLQISRTVKAPACALGLEKQGIMVHMVDTYSIRAGGAMELKLPEKSDKLIMNFGR